MLRLEAFDRGVQLVGERALVFVGRIVGVERGTYPSGCASERVATALPDFVMWAESMGCAAIRVESPEEVAPAIEKANAINDRPVVVEFRTEASEGVFPMVPAGQSNDDLILHPSQRERADNLK